MGVVVFLTLAVLLGVYFLPAIIAKARDLRNFGSIFLLDLFLGWTLIGWVGALCWACAGTAEIKPAPVPGQPWPPR